MHRLMRVGALAARAIPAAISESADAHAMPQSARLDAAPTDLLREPPFFSTRATGANGAGACVEHYWLARLPGLRKNPNELPGLRESILSSPFLVGTSS
jgi:hypothetical protein